MTDLASLTVTINGKQALRESRNLKRGLQGMGRSAIKAEAQTGRLKKGLGSVGQVMRTNTVAAGALNGGVQTLIRSMRSLGIVVASFGGIVFGFAGIAIATTSAASFSVAIAEVNTLIDKSYGSLTSLTKATTEFSREFGTTTTEQAKALYQVISAGAADAAGAIDILGVANKLAKGGVTDVDIAVNGLTSVLNAYGLEAYEAINISDTLFVGMKFGKTTIEELSVSLGQVLPIAAAVGISIEQVTAAVSALTTQGITTKIATTQIRALLSALLKPTAETLKVVERFGITFTTAELASKGFSLFFSNLKGQIEAAIKPGETFNSVLAKLFPNIESLIPSLAFAGGAAGKYTDIVEAMGIKTGETDKATQKLAQSLGDRLNTAAKSIGTQLEKGLGDPFLGKVVPLLEGVDENLGTIGKTAKVVGTALIPVFALVGIFAFTKALQILIGVGLRIAGVFAALNPWVAVFLSLIALSALLLGTKSAVKEFGGEWDLVTDSLGETESAFDRLFNTVNKGTTKALDAIKNYAQLSLIFIGQLGTNELFSSIGFLGINARAEAEAKRAAKLNDEREARNAARAADKSEQRRRLGSLRPDQRRIKTTEQALEANAQALLDGNNIDVAPDNSAELLQNNASKAYLQSIRDEQAVRRDESSSLQNRLEPKRFANEELAREIALIKEFVPEGARQVELIKNLNYQYGTLKDPIQKVNMDLDEKIRLLKIQDPQEQKIETALSKQLSLLRAQQPVSQAEIEALRERITLTHELEAALNTQQTPLARYKNSLLDLAETIQNAFVSAFQASGDAIADFVLDGKSLIDSFKGIVKQLIRQLISLAAQKYLLAPLLGGIGGTFGFAKGGVIQNGSIVPFANGGVVGTATTFPLSGNRTGLMAEDGPEAIMPLARGKGGKLGVRSSGGGGGGVNFVNNVTLNVKSDGEIPTKTIAFIAQMISSTTEVVVKKVLADESRPGGSLAQA